MFSTLGRGMSPVPLSPLSLPLLSGSRPQQPTWETWAGCGFPSVRIALGALPSTRERWGTGTCVEGWKGVIYTQTNAVILKETFLANR